MALKEARSNCSVRAGEPWRITPPPSPPGPCCPGGRLGPTADDEMVRLILRRARVSRTLPVGLILDMQSVSSYLLTFL